MAKRIVNYSLIIFELSSLLKYKTVYLSSTFFPPHEVGITFIILFLLSDTVSYIFISSWHHIPEISLDSLGPLRKILL